MVPVDVCKGAGCDAPSVQRASNVSTFSVDRILKKKFICPATGKHDSSGLRSRSHAQKKGKMRRGEKGCGEGVGGGWGQGCGKGEGRGGMMCGEGGRVAAGGGRVG